MSKCDFKYCQFDAWKSNKKCVLHCSKINTEEDLELFKVFMLELKQYISKNSKYNGKLPDNRISDRYFNMLHVDGSEPSYEECIDCQFSEINFPKLNEAEELIKIVNKLKSVYFYKCEISFSNLELRDKIGCAFEKCVFLERFNIPYLPLIDTEIKYQYKSCIFRNNVYFCPPIGNNISYNLFKDCDFTEKKVLFKFMNVEKPIFTFSENKYLNIETLSIKKSIFNNSIFFAENLNHIKISNITIEDCEFKSKLVFDEIKLKKLEFLNTQFNAISEIKESAFDLMNLGYCNFRESADFFGSNFVEFQINRSDFQKFAGFEKCKFGGKRNVEFTYVNFNGFSNFRQSIFNGGLNLDNANFGAAPNFFKSYLYYDGTTRETYRIIKHSFDQVGNYIEANKAFACEMEKYRQECKWYNPRRFVLLLNVLASNFGQWYLLPLIWIIVISGFISFLYLNQFHENLLVCINGNEKASYFNKLINNAAKSIVPFKSIMKNHFEALSLLLYVVYASLIWQLIVAIKRHSKR